MSGTFGDARREDWCGVPLRVSTIEIQEQLERVNGPREVREVQEFRRSRRSGSLQTRWLDR